MEQEPPPPDEQPPETPPEPGEEDNEAQQSNPDAPLEETLVEAAKAAIPADLLAALAKGNAPRRMTGGGTGKRRKSGLRGKPLSARPGLPRGGARLARGDTLRAAVPWQEVRRRETGAIVQSSASVASAPSFSHAATAAAPSSATGAR